MDTPHGSVAGITVEDSAGALREAMIGAAGPAATGWLGPLALPAVRAEGESVVILGAGIGGLTAAYELSKLGYDCTVIEAQGRVGGRSRTARNGDELFELDGDGVAVATHTCAFDDDLYLNLGPGRIPHQHRRVLSYCHELGVALEPYVMETTANLVALCGPGGMRWAGRRVANDTRGHLAAMLAKTLTARDAFTGGLLDLLDVFGALDDDREYRGSTRTGYVRDLDVHEFPQPAPPLGLEELVASEFWKASFYQPVDYLWQATMFQPVGGMDQIVEGFRKRIIDEYGDIFRLNAPVTGIELHGTGVVVHYVQGGREQAVTADYCLSNIPLPVLRPLVGPDFSGAFCRALEAVDFAKTCKVGWQANTRFWEGDHNQIYGGISWTDHNITQMWYPSNDYFSPNGTLTGAYNFDDKADALGDLSPDERLGLAREGAKELHPEFDDPAVVPDELGVSIAWHKVPFQLGGWAAWKPSDPDHMVAYKQLLQPEGDGRFFVIGDQASPLPGWQEGAMMSAHYVIEQMLGIIPLTVPEPVAVPDSVALTQGLH